MASTTESLPSQQLLSAESLELLEELWKDHRIQPRNAAWQFMGSVFSVEDIQERFGEQGEFLSDLTEPALAAFWNELREDMRCAGCGRPVEWDICCEWMEEQRCGA